MLSNCRIRLVLADSKVGSSVERAYQAVDVEESEICTRIAVGDHGVIGRFEFEHVINTGYLLLSGTISFDIGIGANCRASTLPSFAQQLRSNY